MGLGAWLSCPAPDQTVAREAPVPRCQRVALGRPFLAPGRAPRSLEPRFQGSPFWETRSLCGASGSRPPTLGLEFEQWALRLGPCLAAPAAKAAVRPPSPARASAPRLSAAGLACLRRTSCSSRFLDRPAHRSFGFRQLVVLVFFTQRFSSSAWR